MRKNRKMGVIMLGVLTAVVTACGGMSEEAQESLDQLMEITDLEEEDARCLFTYKSEEDSYLTGWSIIYTEANEFVEFEETRVVEGFEALLGAGCFRDNGGFSYDLDEDEIRIYLDCDTEDGNLSIISYNIGNDEYELMIDAEKYEASDEFIEAIESYELIDIMKDDIEEFKDMLEENEISYEEISTLDYEDITGYLEDAE